MWVLEESSRLYSVSSKSVSDVLLALTSLIGMLGECSGLICRLHQSELAVGEVGNQILVDYLGECALTCYHITFIDDNHVHGFG